MRCWIGVLIAVALSGCAVAPTRAPAPAPAAQASPQVARPGAADVSRFRAVVARVEPVAERICRQETANMNCDFNIGVAPRADLPPNALQTLDKDGRPVLLFTQALLAHVDNADELAFVLSHEAAHHIAGHIPRSQRSAVTGAIVLGGLATILGADSAGVEAAIDSGAALGARRYSKDFELEADAIGTVIAHRAGYDPVRGAVYFSRIADPGDRFLGTHPPNAQRIETVRRVAAGL